MSQLTDLGLIALLVGVGVIQAEEGPVEWQVLPSTRLSQVATIQNGNNIFTFYNEDRTGFTVCTNKGDHEYWMRVAYHDVQAIAAPAGHDRARVSRGPAWPLPNADGRYLFMNRTDSDGGAARQVVPTWYDTSLTSGTPAPIALRLENDDGGGPAFRHLLTPTSPRGTRYIGIFHQPGDISVNVRPHVIDFGTGTISPIGDGAQYRVDHQRSSPNAQGWVLAEPTEGLLRRAILGPDGPVCELPMRYHHWDGITPDGHHYWHIQTFERNDRHFRVVDSNQPEPLLELRGSHRAQVRIHDLPSGDLAREFWLYLPHSQDSRSFRLLYDNVLLIHGVEPGKGEVLVDGQTGETLGITIGRLDYVFPTDSQVRSLRHEDGEVAVIMDRSGGFTFVDLPQRAE